MSMLAQLSPGVTYLLPAAVFGLILFGAWALMSLRADHKQKPLDRLNRLNPGGVGGVLQAEPSVLRQQSRVQELLEMAAPALSKPENLSVRFAISLQERSSQTV